MYISSYVHVKQLATQSTEISNLGIRPTTLFLCFQSITSVEVAVRSQISRMYTFDSDTIT